MFINVYFCYKEEILLQVFPDINYASISIVYKQI
jgi:hypothetical protein